MAVLLRSAPAVLLSLTLLLTAAAGYPDVQSRPLVATREGIVRGVARRSAAGGLFFGFKGIPYARAPLGPLRFQPPQRHPGWADVLDGLKHGSTCLQYNSLKNYSLEGDEDCLFANVYTPQLPALKKAVGGRAVGGLPVMVFIHGGSFTEGSGDEEIFGPNYFMDEAVVLVTFNYRLGPFGFFTTHDKNAPGNYGLLDQVMLLQWVRDNIARLGGDPATVTVFGTSAGGASVSLLVLSPLAKGLFHRAISQSGTALTSFAAGGKAKDFTHKFAEQLNCSADDVSIMVECVRNAPSEDLMEAKKKVRLQGLLFHPRVDHELESPLLPKDPRYLIKNGEFNLVPWMNGIAEEEGARYARFFLRNKSVAEGVFSRNPIQWGILNGFINESGAIPLDCGSDSNVEIAKVIDFYVGNATLSHTNPLPLVRAIADRLFVAPMSEEVRLASLHAPVYKYVLDYRGPGRLSAADVLGIDAPYMGPTHGDVFVYLFSNARQTAYPGDSPTYTMIRFMMSLWTSFARTGRPSSTVLPTPDWPVFTEHSQRHMRLNAEPSVGERLFDERVRFWQGVRMNEAWRHEVQTSCLPDGAEYGARRRRSAL
ncbi:acylcarnitine hydrolase-like [Pollicipes pollicipes]|uniref:acylcarnitine hydrolase-like n=1 Tax=Pollicipes pollicipes TaxID=41117 RepID=UPI001884D9B7|nr:acylcarnitine hydrolase-like [Pollicipes pollicipes]